MIKKYNLVQDKTAILYTLWEENGNVTINDGMVERVDIVKEKRLERKRGRKREPKRRSERWKERINDKN